MNNRSRFVAPNDNRNVQGLFSTPPPNFNWQGPQNPSNEYPLPTNEQPFQNPPVQQGYNQNPPVQQGYNQNPPVQQVYNQNPKNYCKTCNSWNLESYIIHVTSPAHKANLRSITYEPNKPEQLMSIKCTRSINPQYEQNNDAQFLRKQRPNDQTFEPISNNNNNNPAFPLPRKVHSRTNDQPYDPNTQPQYQRKQIARINQSIEPINPVGYSVAKKSTARVTIPPFKVANSSNENVNLSENIETKRLKIRRNKQTPNEESSLGFNQNNFQNPHSSEDPYFDKNDNVVHKKMDDSVTTKSGPNQVPTPVTANKGREMLLPVSGVYCTLCDEFFRNTDAAETKHCASAAHIDAYEKLKGQMNTTCVDKRPFPESMNDKPQSVIKRTKVTPKSSKPTKSLNKSPDTTTSTTAAVDNSKIDKVGPAIESTNVCESMDLDKTSSSEFQGPDVSLEFPDEAEDYDE